MTDITMVGLGAMGGALARAFLGAGHATTVWNRTSSKIVPDNTLNRLTKTLRELSTG